MRISQFIILVLLLTFTVSSAQKTANIRVHDPVVAKENGKYYLFNTGKGIGVYASTDLENWEKMPPVFPEKPAWTDSVVPDFENHIWAPDIIKKGDTWYLFYSVSAFAKNTSAIGVATNRTLDPSDANFQWIDHGIVVRSIPDRDMWNAIDPNIIFDENENAWMAFGSFWNGLKMVKLSEDLTKIAQPEAWRTIARRQRSFKLDNKDPGDAALEAPFIFKKGDWYYLFLSWDLCCRGKESTYKVVVGRSEKATGPFFDKNGIPLNQGGGSIVLEGNEDWYGRGHNSVYHFEGEDLMFFHAYDANDNGAPKLGIRKIDWINGWPVLKDFK